ncbi:hypothetical protein [Zavarzinella formosa]|uniref:hypothetical protein n=1 Tax=Zavarzinella formosa TaxID=360055 RepID=UPI0002E4E1F2|nr:hypothetical protein [Zavarzinella formosa]
MIRKFVAAGVAVVLAVGSVFAEEIKAVFVKNDDKTITVKVDDKEKTYQVDTAKKIKFKTKDGEEKEITIVDGLKRRKEGDKVTLTVEGEKVVGVKAERKGDKK